MRYNDGFDDDDDEEVHEKELEIKLDITKKSRKIGRPVTFVDQPGRILEEVFGEILSNAKGCSHLQSF